LQLPDQLSKSAADMFESMVINLLRLLEECLKPSRGCPWRRTDVPMTFLNFLPDPQGQGSFRPVFAVARFAYSFHT
jgi:hypothetical protein